MTDHLALCIWIDLDIQAYAKTDTVPHGQHILPRIAHSNKTEEVVCMSESCRYTRHTLSSIPPNAKPDRTHRRWTGAVWHTHVQ